MARKQKTPLNPGESASLKAAVFDLSEIAAKQMLYGMIQLLSAKNSILVEHFRDCLDDARKYSQIKNQL